MKKVLSIIVILSLVLTSCVSKKKFVALEEDLSTTKETLTNTKGELQKTTVEKEQLEARFAKIEQRVTDYNTKINSLNTTNSSLTESNNSLNNSLFNVNYDKLVMSGASNDVVMSTNFKNKMAQTLSRMSPGELANATTLKDSINLAIAYNFRKNLGTSNDEDINIQIDKTVVMISVSDKMLFNSGSYRVKSKANKILEKLATIINSEPSMDVIIEGHTDAQAIKTSVLKDNWDLSVKRATSIVRVLQKKYSVDPTRLIASGRSSYFPIADNATKDGRSKNRRTNIIILPNLNKFFALLQSEDTAYKK